MQVTPQQLEPLIPSVIRWAAEEEVRALNFGEPLNQLETEYARKIGVVFPERVRLLKVPTMPFPTEPLLKNIANEMGLLSQADGMTLRYAIFIRENRWRELKLVVHELAHTFQYEQHGGLSLLRQFILEYFIDGYLNSSLEREAISTEERFFGPR